LLLFPPVADIKWLHGLIVVPVAWLVAMVLGAVPLYLSGHFGSFLDASFDAMSGFATTGLVLIQDIDHLPEGINFWRHLTHFIGGQGIVVAALTLFTRGMLPGAYAMYESEAREERVLPNVIQTARFIWIVSVTYLVVGSTMLWLVGVAEGIPPVRALMQGLNVFMAAFDTGGFAPQSQSILYYHSFPYEIVIIPIMVAGTINFGLHFALWNNNRRELLKNIEVLSLTTTIVVAFTVTALALTRVEAYSGAVSVFRKGFFQLLSAHSGTGFMTIYARQFPLEWKSLAMAAITVAMALGGSAGSTAGGVKALRIGIIFKSFIREVKRLISPPSAVIVETYHHLRNVVLEDKHVRNVMFISIAYFASYTLGAFFAMYYGYSFGEALFESVSATANVGLSAGITSPTMPALLKVVFILQMWAGRLEFLSVSALLGTIIAVVRGR
jgi:trk system potassium uptake protein TrkH